MTRSHLAFPGGFPPRHIAEPVVFSAWQGFAGGSFPSDEALTKLFYLALRNISQRWTCPSGTGRRRSPALPSSLKTGCLSGEPPAVYTKIGTRSQLGPVQWRRRVDQLEGPGRHRPSARILHRSTPDDDHLPDLRQAHASAGAALHAPCRQRRNGGFPLETSWAPFCCAARCPFSRNGRRVCARVRPDTACEGGSTPASIPPVHRH